MMVDTFKVTSKPNLADHLTTFGSIGRGHFILWEDGFEGAFRDAGTAIDAGIRVNIKPGVFLHWLTTDDAFHRAYISTSRISQAQARNDMGHDWFLLMESIRLECFSAREKRTGKRTRKLYSPHLSLSIPNSYLLFKLEK
jgi:hypothetical protein